MRVPYVSAPAPEQRASLLFVGALLRVVYLLFRH
jgi:hypothetical protein